MMNAQIIFTVFLILFFCNFLYSQTDTSKKISEKKITIGGYIQSQFQVVDSIGANTAFAGGNFESRFTDKRFQIRRGRIQVIHKTNSTKAMFSIDVTEKGVSVKDAYLCYLEHYLNSFTITTGIFSRPFGFDVEYSSSLRETPERSRVVQTIFPNERDIGAMLSFQLPEKFNLLHSFKLDFAFVNGNSINTETDITKDFLYRIKIKDPFKTEKFSLGLGFSAYNGAINHIHAPVDTTTGNQDLYNIYKLKTKNGITFFEMDTAATKATGTMGGPVDRIYKGFDMQLSYDFPFGKTELRGEYIWGQQPAAYTLRQFDDPIYLYLAMNTYSPTGPALGVAFSAFNTPSAPFPYIVGRFFKYQHTFIRNFNGGYITFVQNILNTGHQLVFRYDWYDPNTAVAGKEIDMFFRDENDQPKLDSLTGNYKLTYLSAADVRYDTYGVGWIWNFNENVKFTVYYDMVKNESTRIPPNKGILREGKMPSVGFLKDVKDNVLTIRLQYKF